MRLALPCLLVLLASCQRAPGTNPLQNMTEREYARFLLVHWPSGPDYVREYADLGHCEAAREAIEGDNSRRINEVDRLNEIRRRGTSPPLPLPPVAVAICLPE